MTTLPQPASTIVPATPGTIAIGFWDSDAPEPYAAPYTVLAWRIGLDEHGDVDDVEPILVETVEVWCLVERHGDSTRYVFPEDRSFETLDDARAYAAQRLNTAARLSHARTARQEAAR